MVAKISPGLESTVAGSVGAGRENLARIENTLSGQVSANAAKPNDGRLAVRMRSQVQTGATTQARDDYRYAPTRKVGAPSTRSIKQDQRIDTSTTSRAAKPGQKELDQTPAAVMARANPIAELLNSAVKDFYRAASGGLAARANRDMAGPLRGVAELRNQLASVISDSASFVAANSADYAALGKWRQGLIKSLGSINTWLKSANAYAAGLTGPGGSKTASPALVRPPSLALSSSVSPRSATQGAAEIRQQYERANAVISRT